MEKIKEFIKDKNAEFYVRIFIMAFMSALAYQGVNFMTLTTWGKFWDAVIGVLSNPAVFFGVAGLSLYQSFRHTSNTNIEKLKGNYENK